MPTDTRGADFIRRALAQAERPPSSSTHQRAIIDSLRESLKLRESLDVAQAQRNAPNVKRI